MGQDPALVIVEVGTQELLQVKVECPTSVVPPVLPPHQGLHPSLLVSHEPSFVFPFFESFHLDSG